MSKEKILNGIKWTPEKIKDLIMHDDNACMVALLRIYSLQTNDEKNINGTIHCNDVGFTGADSRILSSIAQFLIKNNRLSTKQLNLVRKKIGKYSNQLFNEFTIKM